MDPKNNPLREIYLKHLHDQKTSGLSIKKYCLKHNLATHKLSYYKAYKLKPEDSISTKKFSKVEFNVNKKISQNSMPKTSLIDPIWLAKFINNLSGIK